VELLAPLAARLAAAGGAGSRQLLAQAEVSLPLYRCMLGMWAAAPVLVASDAEAAQSLAAALTSLAADVPGAPRLLREVLGAALAALEGQAVEEAGDVKGRTRALFLVL
jgi:hypothetical protein